MYTPVNPYILSGVPIKEAKSALIMIHGRGGDARDMVNLKRDLQLSGMAIYAPQAANFSWYPYSFMAPEHKNQPALNHSLEVISSLVKEIQMDGLPEERIYFLGFSQGACLLLEYLAREAKHYGGAVAFTGGLIGEHIYRDKYQGDFKKTPILITTGDPDPHVPLQRVKESSEIITGLNANLMLKIYTDRKHTILWQEVNLANEFIFTPKSKSKTL